MTMSTNSPYHVVSQTPVEAGFSPDVEDGHDDDIVNELAIPPSDKRIMWMHFILGCAVLLPWNGIIFLLYSPALKVLND